MFLGNSYDDEYFLRVLKNFPVKMERLSLLELAKKCAKKMAEGNIGGVFPGRIEFGPRALGNRSIIADPRKKRNASIHKSNEITRRFQTNCTRC